MEKRQYLTKVLLVDSDEKFLDYEKQLLENIVPGSILLALDGRQAYNIFREYYPDIIIMNSALPLMNGNELISNIRETQTLIDTQIIVINDNYDVVEEAVALKLGANNFITKPLKPITLMNYFNNANKMVGLMQELRFEKYVLEQNARIDSLTGLANIHYLYERFREETEKARRYKRTFSCMQLIFDSLEEVTLEYNDAVANKVLKDASKCVKSYLRESDVIGRLEEDIFGVLLPETNIEQAFLAGKKIQDMIGSKEFV
ncbi:diguanylate cyclase, partial [bacterium]|nr:diguanylate cyclase [bacterium]